MGLVKIVLLQKIIKLLKHQQVNICVMNVEYINVLTILKVFIKENLNNSFIIF